MVFTSEKVALVLTRICWKQAGIRVRNISPDTVLCSCSVVRVVMWWDRAILASRPDPSEPVGHALTDSPLGSWHAGILLSSRQGFGKPPQQRYGPAVSPHPGWRLPGIGCLP